MLCIMWCLALQSMAHTNHTFPAHATWNVQAHLKSIVELARGVWVLIIHPEGLAVDSPGLADSPI